MDVKLKTSVSHYEIPDVFSEKPKKIGDKYCFVKNSPIENSQRTSFFYKLFCFFCMPKRSVESDYKNKSTNSLNRVSHEKGASQQKIDVNNLKLSTKSSKSPSELKNKFNPDAYNQTSLLEAKSSSPKSMPASSKDSFSKNFIENERNAEVSEKKEHALKKELLEKVNVKNEKKYGKDVMFYAKMWKMDDLASVATLLMSLIEPIPTDPKKIFFMRTVNDQFIEKGVDGERYLQNNKKACATVKSWHFLSREYNHIPDEYNLVPSSGYASGPNQYSFDDQRKNVQVANSMMGSESKNINKEKMKKIYPKEDYRTALDLLGKEKKEDFITKTGITAEEYELFFTNPHLLLKNKNFGYLKNEIAEINVHMPHGSINMLVGPVITGNPYTNGSKVNCFCTLQEIIDSNGKIHPDTSAVGGIAVSVELPQNGKLPVKLYANP